MGRPATLGQYAWPQVASVDLTLLVPVGSFEQHGPHLPLDTDTRIASGIAHGARAGLADDAPFVVAPEIAYGASGEHEGFAGTISLGHDALAAVILEYGRSACRWAQRIVFVNGHGGNVATVVTAVTRLRYESREIAWYPCLFDGVDAHAGHTETSIMMHLAPEMVHTDRLEAGNREPVSTLMAPMRSGGVAAVSPNGILGDPRLANAAEGERLLGGAVADLIRALAEWTVDDRGRLR